MTEKDWLPDETDEQWLNSEPDSSEIEKSPYGGFHIPIDKLRPLLDRLNASSKNYHTSFYKDTSGALCANGAIELTVAIDGTERTVTGAFNLNIADPIGGFWNGTLKSECVKNAAIELGRRLGRGLNKELALKRDQDNRVTSKTRDFMKVKPDEKIIRQYQAALERKDEAAIITLTNLYEIKTDA